MGLLSTWAKFDGHIYHGYPIIMQKYLPFIMYYGSAMLLFTLNYIAYKHFDRSLHLRSSDPTYVQNFRPVYISYGFEILGKTRVTRRRNGDYLPC